MDKHTHLKRNIFIFLLVTWPYFLNDFYLIVLTKDYIYLNALWIADVIFYTAIPLTTLLILRKKNIFTFAEIGFTQRTPLLYVPLLVLLGLLVHIIITSHLEIWLYAHNCFKTCNGYAFYPNGLLKWLSIIYAALSAAFMEEIIFRGLLFKMLKSHIAKTWLILIIANLIFASIHWCLGSGKLISTFIMGIIISLVYLRKGRLSDAILTHLVINILAFK